MQAVTVLTLASCLSAGLLTGLLAHMKLTLARKPDSAPRLALWLPLLNLALVALVGLSGVVVDTFGIRPALVGGSALAALALLAAGFSGPGSRSPLPLLAAAVGGCALYVCALRLMPPGLLGKHEAAASINLGLVFIAMGGLLAPPLFELLRAAAGFPGALALLGALAASPAALCAFTPEADLDPPGAVSLLGLVTDPTVWAAGLVYFMYAPLEAFVCVWATTYCESHGDPPATASRWLAWFWCSFVLSRVLLCLVMHVTTGGDKVLAVYLVVPALLAAVCLGNMSGSARHTQALSWLVLLGVCLGPVLPMLLAILGTMKASTNGPAAAFGLLFACGALGSLILSPLVGWSAREKNVQAGLRIPMFLCLALTVASLFFALMHSQQ